MKLIHPAGLRSCSDPYANTPLLLTAVHGSDGVAVTEVPVSHVGARDLPRSGAGLLSTMGRA